MADSGYNITANIQAATNIQAACSYVTNIKYSRSRSRLWRARWALFKADLLDWSDDGDPPGPQLLELYF